jgi:hypothetical protein
MRASLAVSAADRISRSAIMLAGMLCGVLVFFVAVPLALSSPFPSPKEGSWIIHRSELHVASPITLPIATDLPSGLHQHVAAASWSFVSLPAYDGPSLFKRAEPAQDVTGSIGATSRAEAGQAADATPDKASAEPSYQLASLPSATTTDVKLDPAPAAAPKRSNAGTIEEVNEYLWEVYQRAPVKKDGAGDFTWKDPAAAKRMNMPMPVYVIGGMDPDFREQLYHAGHAMDEAGIHWSILSGFRDDYRQSIASGLKAGNSNSLHGGKARTGGYGHGQAVDITNAGGNDETVWRWVDRNGAKYGLARPMPGYDPAHIQPREGWHKIAANFRATRTQLAAKQNAAAPKTAAADQGKREAKAE